MARYRSSGQSRFRPCPFINLNDTRCAAHFTLGRIAHAFGVCLDHHHTCTIYDRLQQEQQRIGEENSETGGQHVGPTFGGRPYVTGDELQPTGSSVS